MSDDNQSPLARSTTSRIVLILWVITVLLMHWIVQGSPGIPAVAEFIAPLRNLIQGFFSAPYLG